MLKMITLAIAVLALLLFSACSSNAEGQSLTEQIWMLTELGGKAPLLETTITAEFSPDGSVSGSSGCNRYSGPYTVDGNNIEMGPFASTLMACPDLIMAQEALYLKALETGSTYQISDDELTIKDKNSNALAVFTVLDQNLMGTSWNVIAYNNGKQAVTSVIIGTEITALFGDDSQLTGSAGCNDYFATYETDADNITIGPAGTTRMACQEPEGIMEQEQAYLAALQTASTYKITGMDMEMRTADGAKVASFQRALAP